MTQEEKAKAYDEALKDMRVIYPNLSGDAKLAIEHAFPQLTESENERIRKSIIHILQVGGYMSPEEKGKALAYLEKQKEREPLTKEEEYTLHRIIEYLEDETCPSEWISLLHDIYCLPYKKQKEQKSLDYAEELKKCKENPLYFYDNYVKIKMKEQKPIKVLYIPKFRTGDLVRSSKNPRLTYKILSVGSMNELGNPDYEVEIFTDGKPDEPRNLKHIEIEKMDSWGELVEQKPEWSEEDKNVIKILIELVEAEPYNNFYDASKDTILEWLKSLKPHWKPSEEQMEALNALNLHGDLSYVGQQNQLISLYQDLKKLM